MFKPRRVGKVEGEGERERERERKRKRKRKRKRIFATAACGELTHRTCTASGPWP
jgi:hypothetical protein